MKTIFTSVDFQEAVLVKETPDEVSVKDGIMEMSFETSILEINGSKKASIMQGLYIEQNQVSMPNDVSVFVKKEAPHLELHFELEGYTSFSNGRESEETISIPQGYASLLYLPELDGKLNFAKSISRKSLEIEFTVEYFANIFNSDLEVLGEFGESIISKTPIFFGGRSCKISPDIYNTLSDIIDCQYRGILRKIYLESKVREVLISFVSQNPQLQREFSENKWSKYDIEKLYAAKEIVQQHIAKPYSIVELAKLVGLNDFKLKKGFKELFGTTIFGYINDLRMNEAKALLTSSAYSIADISFVVGFKNPQHFTNAFKRKFGIVPKMVRGRRN